MLNEALMEYRGLMREQPYNDSPFLRTARIFLDMGDLPNARVYLEQAIDIEVSAFAAKMLGAIEVDAGNIDRGIELLEQARSLEPYDPQTLFNLSGAYGLKNQFEKADEILKILEQRNPNFPGARSWRIQLNGHLRR
jgi:tetratricopeptide (TPR) repeat protein